ncbi:APC family permease [Dongia deserti]|uniref:APC family permease n=1 Tax=Dongia deserti TaxID=2268030 RepID=UPI000E650EF6|nr:APC family permease [Dongia deserti]
MAEAFQSTVQAKGAPGSDQLRRNVLGVAAITFFVVSAAAPLTAVAGGYPIAMLLGNGPGIPAAVVLVTLILLVFSVGYTAMARHISNAGSFYAFTSRGLGGVAGGAAAYIALLAYNTMQIGLYGLFGAVTAGTLEGMFGIAAPWWVWSLVALAIVAYLGYRQIDLSAKVLAVLVTAEYIVVLILDASIIGQGGAAGLDLVSFTPESFFTGSATIGVLICFAAFMGFEATTIYSEEARDPKRTVPRATYASVLIIGIFYAISTWCMVVAVGVDKLLETLGGLTDPTNYLFGLSDQYAGSWLTWIMSLLLVTSVFAALLAFHNAAARYFYVLGREGLLPAKLGQTHDSHQSPHLGSALQTGLALAVMAIFVITGQDPIFALFTWLTNTATLSVITLMALVSFAVLTFFKQQPVLEPSVFKATLAPLVAGIVLAIIAVLVVANFGLLTGAAPWLAIALPALVPIAAALGALAANRLKQSEPARFARLGAHQAAQ